MYYMNGVMKRGGGKRSKRRRRKGMLEELLSKAIYADDASAYTVIYRDRDILKELSLEEFLRLSENFQSIPASRIVCIKRYGTEIYYSARAKKTSVLNDEYNDE